MKLDYRLIPYKLVEESNPYARKIKIPRAKPKLSYSEQEFKQLSDGENIYAYFESLQKRIHNPLDEISNHKGEVIGNFTYFVKELLQQRLGVKFEFKNPFANYKPLSSKYFENHKPKTYLVLYETLANYANLAKFAQNSLNTKFTRRILPKEIQIVDDLYKKTKYPADFTGSGHDTIRMDTLHFISPNEFAFKKNLEHELGHFYNEKHFGSSQKNSFMYKSCNYLHLLNPEEQQTFSQFTQIFKQNYNEILNPLAEQHKFAPYYVKKSSLDFPDNYKPDDPTLIMFEAFINSLVPVKNIINNLGQKNGIKNLFEKVLNAGEKLVKFEQDYKYSIDYGDYFRSCPEESKAQAFAARAGVNGFRTEKSHNGTTVLLPVSEEMEENLAKLGMPPPMTYTILPKDYFNWEYANND